MVIDLDQSLTVNGGNDLDPSILFIDLDPLVVVIDNRFHYWML